jgi:exodeoxyribonuclease VII large subunit
VVEDTAPPGLVAVPAVFSTWIRYRGPVSAADAPPASSREHPLEVADVVKLAQRRLDDVGLIWLEGEITQVSRPASGHVYFALRDRDAVLPAVLWSRDAARVKLALEAGMKVRVRGRLGVYQRDGKMQLYVDFAEPAGLGAEAAALAALKAKLAAEGLFAAGRKRPLPRFPRRIGVVTSKSGAAVHDIIRTVMRRFPTPILICDALVQGPQAPRQIAQGMGHVVRAGVDLVIVGRGGGAATDLAAFNSEVVARTIARCPVPVISAVGHEVDLSLADLVADHRASTPTAAAELAVPDGVALEEQLRKDRSRLDREIRLALGGARQDLDRHLTALGGRVERTLASRRGALAKLHQRLTELHPRARIAARRAALAALERRLTAAHPGPRVAKGRLALDGLVARREAAIARHLAAQRAGLAQAAAQLAALSPLAVMDRGYALARRGPPGRQVIRAASELAVGERLELRLARGVVDVTVTEIHDEPEESS